MKIIFVIEDHAAVTAAENIFSLWAEEHASYYGKPCGQKRILSGMEWANCGCSGAFTPRPGYGLPIPGRRWLTSGGNDHRLSVRDGIVTAAYSGRRHGMRNEFREFVKDFWNLSDDRHYESRSQDWNPWETADDRKVSE